MCIRDRNNELALTDNGHGDVCKYYSYDMHQMIPDILIGNIAFLDGLSAVSYTHLDVYKRQSPGPSSPLWMRSKT